MTDDLRRLRRKLCRELAQAEHDAVIHPRREASRLGDVPPAQALLAIAEHAARLRPRLDAKLRDEQPMGLSLGRAVAETFSAIRHFLVDRILDAERSYRGTLLGLRHGVDVARLLREVALREVDAELVHLCDELLVDRAALLEEAEQALAWFAEQPSRALAPGARVALESGAHDDV
jgi:hypothetical protein